MKRQVNIAFDKDATQLTLKTNLRNTAKIFESVKKHFHKEIDLDHKGVEGRQVEVLEPYNHKNRTELFFRLKTVINKLVETDQIPPKDIVILTFKSMKKSHMSDFQCDYPLFIFSDDPKCDGIRIETVRRFKGMESKIVIVTEMDDETSLKDPTMFDDMCYVSFSRAVHHLIILPPDDIKLN